MTIEEIKEILNIVLSDYLGIDKDKICEYNGYDLEEATSGKTHINGYLIQEVEDFGGEGQGDTMWKVFSITNIESAEIVANFRVTAYYDSWNGADWTGEIELVKPVEVKVIQWEKI